MKNIGGCAQVTCKYYAIVYKGLEILVGRLGELEGQVSWNQFPHGH